MNQIPSKSLASSQDKNVVAPSADENRLSRLFYGTLQEITVHTLVMAASLGSIWLIHLLLNHLVGADKKFFNIIPLSWVIDTGDILVIGKFLWEVIKGFLKERR